jgi:ABC-type polysaccharide/polyol phosphate export permease
VHFGEKEKSMAINVVKDLRLAWLLSKRDLKNRFASSYAGAIWSIGVPLVYAMINIVVFSLLMRGRMGDRYGDVPFTIFYFVALIQWTFFSEVVPRSAGIIREYSFLLKTRVGFPVWIIPLIPLASAFVNQLVIVLLCVICMLIYQISPGEMTPLFLLVWILSILVTIGFAYTISAISVFVPDMAQVVPIFVNIIFWLTPILYPPTLVEQASTWARYVIMVANPFYYITEASRMAVLGSGEGLGVYIAIATIFAGIVLCAGSLVFRKLRPGFADVV